MKSDAALSPCEREVVDSLAQAWNCFLRLPVEHADDTSEFRAAIHRAQDIVLARPARRLLNREG